MKSRLFRVLARAGCFRLLSPGILVCLPLLVSSASFGLMGTSPTKSSSKSIICCGLSCSMEGRFVYITSMYSFQLMILSLHHLPTLYNSVVLGKLGEIWEYNLYGQHPSKELKIGSSATAESDPSPSNNTSPR